MSLAQQNEMSHPPTSSGAWSPESFVLHGQFCPPEAICGLLDEVRQLTSARAVLQVAIWVKPGNEFQPTSIGSHYVMRSLLLSSDLPGEALAPDSLAECFTEGTEASKTICFPPSETSGSFRTLFREHLDLEPFSKLKDLIGEDTEVCVVWRDEPIGATMGHVVPVLLVLGGVFGDEAASIDETMKRLITWNNGSMAATARRTRGAENEVNRIANKIRPQIFKSVGNLNVTETLNTVAWMLLRIAVKVTKSSGGIIFLTDPADGAFNKNSTVVFRAEDCDAVGFGDANPELRDWAYEHLRTYADTEQGTAAGKKIHSIYVPIFQRQFRTKAPLKYGVIYLRRDDDSAPGLGQFSSHDLAFIKHIAQRYAFWRIRLLADFNARCVRLLNQEDYRNYAAPAGKDGGENKDERREYWHQIPQEYWLVDGATQQSLDALMKLTRCHTVDLRLLSPDTSKLIRVCSSSSNPDRRSPACYDFNVQPSLKSSTAAGWVSSTGHRVIINDTDELEKELAEMHDELQRQGLLNVAADTHLGTIQDLPKNVRSLGCFPVVIGKRLVGTLYLGCVHRGGLDEFDALCELFCEQIAQSLLLARRHPEQEFAIPTATAKAGAHDMKKCVNAAKEILQDNSEWLEGETSLRENLRKLALLGAGFKPPNAADKSRTYSLRDEIPVLVEHTRRSDWDCEVDDRIDTKVTERERQHIAKAFHEIMYNAELHGKSPRKVRVESITCGRAKYMRIIFSNQIRNHLSALDDKDSARVYRVPLTRESSQGNRTVSYGAFLAGALIRSIDGDVFVVEAADEQFAVGVDIPMY